MRDPGLRSEHRAELQVGALVLVSLVAMVAGIVWITGADIGGERFRFHVLAPEAAQVSGGSRVYLHGVDVGAVQNVRLVPEGALLEVEVRGEVSLPADSRALIKPSGFLGSQMVQLVPGGASRAVSPGDTIAGGTGEDLQTVAAELGSQAEAVLERTARVLSDTTVASLQASARDLSGSMAELRGLVESERETLQALVRSLRRTSENLSAATDSPRLERTVAQIDTLTARLGRASAELDASGESLNSILAKMDRGEGTLGKLVNDDRLYERATAAAENLQAASEEIALLSQDLRENPEKYLGNLKFSVF